MRQVSIEITQKCMNSCIHCSSLSDRMCRNIIPKDKIFEIIDNIKELNMDLLCISGGEPFLHKDLPDIVRYGKEHHITIYIYTSGIIADKYDKLCSLSMEILSELNNIGVDKLIFDMPAVDENIYDTFMGVSGHFGYAIDSIKKSVKAGITTELHFVPTKLNVGQIDDVMKFAADNKISCVSFLRLVCHGRAQYHTEELMLSNEDTVQLKEKLIQIKHTYGNLVRIGTPLQSNSGECVCNAGIDKLVVRCDGRVFGCEAFKYITLYKDNISIIPNSIYENSLTWIYHNSEYLQTERKITAVKPMYTEICPTQKIKTALS